MKPKIDFFLAIKWSTPFFDKLCRGTESFLRTIDQTEYKKNMPIHWIISSHPYLESKHRGLMDLIVEIKTRVHSLGDMPLSAGYSGALFPLLAKEELEQELLWSLTNPWESGIKDLFGYETPVLCPEVTDLSRPGLEALYIKTGFKFIGSTDILHWNHLDTGSQLQILHPVILKPGISFRDLKKQISGAPKKNYFFYYIDIVNHTDITSPTGLWPVLLKTFRWLRKKYTVSFTSIDKSLHPGRSKFQSVAPGAQYQFLNAPALRERMALADHHRKQPIKIKSEYRKIITCFTHSQDVHEQRQLIFPPKKTVSFPPADRINDCTMQGETRLMGTDFSVEFNCGRIINLINKDSRPILAGFPAESYAGSGKKQLSFDNISAVSISSELCSGMRETQRIRLPGSRDEGYKLSDYIFIDNFPLLVVTSKIIYPSVDRGLSNKTGKKAGYGRAPISRLTPFKLPLFTPVNKKSVPLLVFTGNSSYEMDITRDRSVYSIPARMIAFKKEGQYILFGFPPGKNKDTGIFEIEFNVQKKQYMINLSLFNTYFRTKAPFPLPITEIFSFYMGICYTKPEKLPIFPAMVLKEIPEYKIIDN